MAFNPFDIFKIESKSDFEDACWQTFLFQFKNNDIYRTFCSLLSRTPDKINRLEEIPFLPIELFKSQTISCCDSYEKVFTSSGTTGQITSKHYIHDLSIYEESFLRGFKAFYGDPKDYIFIGLLPSYLEREGSSLIYMVDALIKYSEHNDSQFSLHPTPEIVDILQDPNKKVMVIGVSYALMDLADANLGDFPNTTFLETGGMKGKRKEMVKSELHDYLKQGLNQQEIHSEYGMTELLSQAYSKEKGFFYCPSWMDIQIRETDDPLSYIDNHKTGGLNIIDLANYYSCSFIATQDLGKKHPDGGFEIMGRFDYSDVRGCNLMFEG